MFKDMTGEDDVKALKALMDNIAKALEDPKLNAQSRATLAGRMQSVRKEWNEAKRVAQAAGSGLGKPAGATVSHIRGVPMTHDLLGGPEADEEPTLSDSDGMLEGIADAI